MSYDANAAYNSGAPGQGAPGAGVPAGQGYGGQGFGGAPRGATSPDDLSLPLYGASFGQAVKRFFKNYVNFKGRASRSEFWYAYLFLILLGILPGIIYGIGAGMVAAAAASDPYGMSTPPTGAVAMLGIGGVLGVIIMLATILPFIGVCWRRLHDANYPGPMFFLWFIPGVGVIIVLILMIMESRPEGQRFDV